MPPVATPITRRAGLASLLMLLSACGGIPLRSVPRLLKLQQQLLDADPAEFALALQVDSRMVPPPAAVPMLELAVRPAVAGAFEPIDKRLPMRVAASASATQGLAPPPPSRRWLIYDLTPESQAELRRLQAVFKRLAGDASSGGKRGGSLAVGIAQEGLAARNPALAHTRWDSWLRTSQADGFYELWSGTVADLLDQASRAR